MNDPNQQIKVIELRNYLLKPGVRDKFIDYFENHFVESQNSLGGFVLGAYRIKNEAERFFWIRGFSDMNSRSRYLPEFYGGEIWKKFGPEANEMMLEWHNVHLLKPIGEIKVEDFLKGKSLVVIDFYFADDNKIGEVMDLFQTANENSKFFDTTFWISETAENDFPPLPVIQAGNLLAAIINYQDEVEYQLKSETDCSNLKNRIEILIKNHERLILYPAAI